MSTARMKRREETKQWKRYVRAISQRKREWASRFGRVGDRRRPTWGECGFKEWRDRLDAAEAKAFFDRLLGLDK